jgi:hypothetical protein
MLEAILPNIDTIYKIILNTVLVSIPEEIYLVMLTLILIGEFDYWKEEECRKIINKWDYSRILIPSVITALLLNILQYTNNETFLTSTFCLLIFYGLIAITNDILNDARPLKWLAKAFVFLIAGQISLGLTEIIYVPFVLNATGKTVAEINNNILLNFLFSLPSRLIQYSIIAIMVNRKRKRGKGSFLTYLVSNQVLLFILTVIAVFDLFFLIVMYNAVVVNNSLAGTSHIMQFVTIICITMLPMLNISAMLWAAFYVKNQEMNGKKSTLDRLDKILKTLDDYSKEEKHGDITWKLNELGIAVEEIAVSLNEGKNPNNKGGKDL